MKPLALAVSVLAFSTACGDRADRAVAPAAGSGPQVTASTMPAIDQQAILDRIKVISADEYEGRAPGSKGEDLTVKYLEDEFKKLGLQPGNPDGTYVQKVPLVGITGAEARPLVVQRAGGESAGGARGESAGGATSARGATSAVGARGTQTFKWKDEVVAWTKHVADGAQIESSELVFVGYGVTAPEFDWNDYKNVDLKGKTLVMLVNDPPVPAADGTLDPKTFGGDAMTYYGRWTYKYEEAARRGAAGAFVVHETGPAGYPFAVVQGFLGERFDLVTPDKNMRRSAVEGWLSLEAAKKLFAMAGQDFDALKKQAVTRAFTPVPLGLRATLGLKNSLRTIDSQNVLAKIEGSDPRLKAEYVVYSAHWDHLGVGDPVPGDASNDRIYNGALDNASGVAGLLEVARAYTQVKPRPKRSVLFLMVTAEEQGLLGSQYYSVAPLYPLEKTVANINIDGINQWGRTKDITVVGMGASDLDDYVRDAAAEQGRALRPDPEPEKGFYYRSDHFNFAKQGVPALYTDSGVEFIGKPADYGQRKREEYTKVDYHQPSDEVKPDWDLSGGVEDMQLMFLVGYRVANADTFPSWKAGNEFKARRDEMLRK